MYIFITLAVISFVTHIATCESTKEPSKDIPAKTTIRAPINEITSSTTQLNVLNEGSLVSNGPTSLNNNQPQEWAEDTRYRMLLKAPHSLTKLAKTLSLGFDPSFSKDYFEPFERRPRPVTLVAFRKKGYASRHLVNKYTDNKSSEVAELQSPYNEISNFWLNEQLEK